MPCQTRMPGPYWNRVEKGSARKAKVGIVLVNFSTQCSYPADSQVLVRCKKPECCHI